MTKCKAETKNSLGADLESGAAHCQSDLILILVIKPQAEKILYNFGHAIFYIILTNLECNFCQ